MNARAVPIEARPAFAAALDRHRNSALCEGIAAMELFAAADGSLLAVDRNRVARLSDPSTVVGAIALASVTPDDLAVARGPVAATDAFVAHLPFGAWSRVFEGIEMAWLDPPALRAVTGELRCSTELARLFEDWRAEFTREVFHAGGSPPVVAPEHLFVWASPAGPHAMAGLVPQGPTGARIVTVYTPPAERGRGYAGALTAALGEYARRRGQDVTLDVSVDDPGARRAYERAGFRAVGHTSRWWRA